MNKWAINEMKWKVECIRDVDKGCKSEEPTSSQRALY